MTTNFQNGIELLHNAVNEQLYHKLVQQVKKDFQLANISIDFSLDLEPHDLATTLREKIYVLIMEKFSDYLNLLYIVDVPEHSFKEIKATDVVEVAEEVSFLILKREWQKIWLKSKYAS
ncbi:hypothetical protein [Spongiimicrobium sp. 3-5]|uniref:hypothetical protein n=1 Tax=Spongiimicrobium sp. 3-5 TaxID=3332596 RepID=UPI003980B6A1